MVKSGLKTKKSARSVSAFIDAISDRQKQKDAETLVKLFKKVTGKQPKMWGSSIVGFGEYHYAYAGGREGDFLATGFSPRTSALTIYIMPGYQDYSAILKKLGPHKRGKSCLYIKQLSDIDSNVLEKLIAQGLKDLKKKHVVK